MTNTLSFKEAGEFVTHGEWNELVLTLQRSISTADGFDDGISSAVQTDTGWQEPSFTGKWEGTGDLKPYSIVQIEEDPLPVTSFVEPIVQTVVDYKGASVLVTNDSVFVPNGKTFSANRIGQFLSKVRYDITDPPLVGKSCGPNSTTGYVSSTRTGLLCLSKPDASSTFLYVYGLGGNIASASISLGVLSLDVSPGNVVTVPILNENLSLTGGEQTKVKNNTGVTLKSGSVVYIYEMVNWPFVGTAKYSMYPAQLQDCGVAKTTSP